MSEEDGAVPPSGWEIPRQQEHTHEHGEVPDQLAQLIEQLLALVPDELRVSLTEAVRQLLEALRALIDWCVARLEQRPSVNREVRDIPIL
jgi:hypothetical protein